MRWPFQWQNKSEWLRAAKDRFCYLQVLSRL